MFGAFGNKVKIKATEETEEKGLAHKTGEIYGETTPSLLDLEVIGSPKNDYAVNVYFHDIQESFWFDKELIEHLDNGQGAVITLDGINKKWVKNESGEWIEENISQRTEKIKWWKFWKK